MPQLLRPFILLLALSGLWLAPLTRAAAPDFAQQASDLPPDPAVRFGKLPNGVRYAILHNAEPKGRASLRFGVTTGSFNETEEQRGLAHFLEHLAFNGSTHFPPGTLVEYFQRLGMSFGGDTNAFTSFDRTEYQLELPDTKPETLDKAFTLFTDYGGGLFLKPESIEKERGIILSEERARDSVGLRAWKAEMEFILPDALVAQRLPIGLKDVISKAQRDRFADYYDTWYRPENFVVVAVGDFDAATVEAQLTQALSGLQSRAPARPKASLGVMSLPNEVVAKLHVDADAPAVTVAIDAVTPYAYEPDTGERRLRRLPRNLALAMLNRRLSILAKKEGAPFSAGEASIGEQFDFFRSASIELTCQPAQWNFALIAADQELRRALTYGFQPAELQEAVASARNGLEQSVKTAATRPSNKLADGLVDAVIDRKVFTAPPDNLKLLGPALDKVTVEDCAAALREAWATPSRELFVTGNLSIPDGEKAVLETYAACRQVPVTAPEKIAAAQFAYTDFGPEGKVVSRREAANLGITLVEFANGVRLNLKPTDFEASRIYVSVRFGGGVLAEPKSQPGMTNAAEGLFTAGGLGRHSLDELQRILAGKTVGLKFGISEDACNLVGTTNRQDLALQLQLFCAYLTDPAYRPEAMRQFRKSIDQAYNRLEHTVEGPFSTQVTRLMAGGDPRFGLAPKDVVLGRTADEVKAWLAPQLAKGAMEIAVVGDFNLEETIVAVAKTFGALPPRADKPEYALEREVSMPATPIKEEFKVSTEIDRGIVRLMWPATDRRDIHRSRRLNLLAEVFGDRLRLKLREQMGGTYSPSVGSNLSETFGNYGYLTAQATVEPARAQEVADAIKTVAASLASDGVTEDELQRAKRPVLTSLKTSERQNGYWLGTVLSAAQELPQHLEWAWDRYPDNESITKADLDALAKQYLPPERASQFISLPEKKTP